jgi:ferredoxin-nitrite reductase
VADVGLLGKKIKVKGEVVEAVDVFVGGRSGPNPKMAIKLLEDVPCAILPEVLSGILPYHSREKMHRTKTKSIQKKIVSRNGVESVKTKKRKDHEPSGLISA